MPTLSNGSELTVWEDTENQSPDAVLFSITETDGDVLGPTGARTDFPFGSVDLASVDVFDGFFTVTTFTNDGRTEIFTTVETMVFDNQGNYIRTLADQAAYLSTEIISVTAESPDDITVRWLGANEYFGGENTQYGQHEIILEDGELQPDSFVNHVPTVVNLNFTLAPGQSLDDIKFSAADLDYDLLSFIVVDAPDHGALAQETKFEEGHYPFHQGRYFDSLHYHGAYLNGNLFDYAPEAGFTGTDTFTVYATDGQGNSNLATITITVVPPPQSITLTDAKDTVSYQSYDHAVLVAAMGGNDRITGSQFGDSLDGGAGKDLLRGGAGDDQISGGLGRDTLFGGEGDDTFVFDVAPGRANYDDIVDFHQAEDVIKLDSSVFSGLVAGVLAAEDFVIGKTARDESDRIIYNKGDLLYDADGAGGVDAVKFATVGNCTWLTADDFVIF